MLRRFGFSPNRLPSPLDDSSNTMSMIRETIYRAFIQTTWVSPLQPLTPKLDHYAKHYFQIDIRLIIPPGYINLHLPLGLRISLRKFQVCSHQLRIETDHYIARDLRVFHLCSLETDVILCFSRSFSWALHSQQFFIMMRDASPLGGIHGDLKLFYVIRGN